mgnify:CR=1 FL=1
MNIEIETNEFLNKFNELNEKNKRYILAIEQALIYAQTEERNDKNIDNNLLKTKYEFYHMKQAVEDKI